MDSTGQEYIEEAYAGTGISERAFLNLFWNVAITNLINIPEYSKQIYKICLITTNSSFYLRKMQKALFWGYNLLIKGSPKGHGRSKQ